MQTKFNEIEILKEEVQWSDLLGSIQRLTNNIQSGVERTTQIISGLRTFSRLDENKITLADIHEGIDSTLLMLYNQFKGRIEIKKDYGKLPSIDCYPGKLNQVFMNLLSNAIQAIDGKGEITIKTSGLPAEIQAIENYTTVKALVEEQDPTDAKSIVVMIKDTGIGIPEHLMEKIFEPFFTTKDVGAGTGLGLSITYGIIKDHKGKIFFDSKPGVGTCVFVLLPSKGKTKKQKMN